MEIYLQKKAVMAQNGRVRKGEAKFIAALAAGQTVRDAAKDAGLSERTAYRRLENVEFRRRVKEVQAEMIARAARMLAAAATDAVVVLRELSGSAQRETVKLAASRTILELVHKLRESAEIEFRLCELEGRVNEQKDA